MKLDFKQARDAFEAYLDEYDREDEKIKLKIVHTYGVVKSAREIGKRMHLNEEDQQLAELIALLHDIGRFEQLRRYNTFSDAQSIDHARFAVELLYDEGLIADYVPEISTTELVTGARTWRSMGGVNESHTAQSEDMPLSDILQTLRIAIGEHSAYRIQKGLDERTRMFCQILRDADKVDIFRVICDTPMEEVYGFQTKDILRSAITPEVMQAFYEHHAVLRKLKKCPADYIVAHGSLTFELVYPESLRIAKEQGYLKQMMSFQSENPDTEEIFEDLRKDLNGYLEERS